MSEKIEACPSGHASTFIDYRDTNVDRRSVRLYAVRCSIRTCWTGPFSGSAEAAITAWNRRPQLTALQAQLDETRAKLDASDEELGAALCKVADLKAQLEVARNAQEIAARSDGENARRLQGANIRIASLEAQLADTKSCWGECREGLKAISDALGHEHLPASQVAREVRSLKSALAEAERKLAGERAQQYQKYLLWTRRLTQQYDRADVAERKVGAAEEQEKFWQRQAEQVLAERDAAREELGVAMHALSTARARVAELEVGRDATRELLIGLMVECVRGTSDAAIIGMGPYDVTHVAAWVKSLSVRCKSAEADRDLLAGELEKAQWALAQLGAKVQRGIS